mmetsp:Transcript_25419/g.74435  ORF Transcript_25419/g.74435 Transcript_25419/m.74435 type:complete len:130 (+) Transcript_25419:1-390(+)
MPKLQFGAPAPTLAELTMMAQEVTAQTCEETMEAAAGAGNTPSSYAIVSGILIHGPEGSHYFWPGVVRVAQEGARASRAGIATAFDDALDEVNRSEREEYMGQMLKYLRAKANSGGMLCQDCGGDVKLH